MQLNHQPPIRIALVGIGGYGGYYVDELMSAGTERSITFIAGIDAYPERSPAYPRLLEAGIPVYADLETFYRHATADLVVIAAPIHLHAPMTITALQHGSHVLCEKPLCATLAEAADMATAEKRSGQRVAIGYQWSFSDPIQSLKHDILAGVLGRAIRLRTLVLWPRYRSYYQRNDWAGRIKTDAGAWVLDSPINNATAHYLHNMLYLLGDRRETSAYPSQVESYLFRANPIENYDAAALRIETSQGVELLMFTAHCVQNSVGPLAVYEFENAVVEYGAEARFTARFHDGRMIDYGNPEETHANKLWNTLEAIRGNDTIACGIETALPHILCVNQMQKNEIRSFPPERVKRTECEDELIWVEGLEQAFINAYESGRLSDFPV